MKIRIKIYSFLTLKCDLPPYRFTIPTVVTHRGVGGFKKLGGGASLKGTGVTKREIRWVTDLLSMPPSKTHRFSS